MSCNDRGWYRCDFSYPRRRRDGTYNAPIGGTFKIAPRFFQQVVIIHLLKTGNGKSHPFPLVIALLTRKTQPLYKAVLETVPEFNPEIMMADFETSLRNELRETFPQCTINGCWFRYTQAVIRKIRKLGFTAQMTTNVEFKNWINSVLVVPLLHCGRHRRSLRIVVDKSFRRVEHRYPQGLHYSSMKNPSCRWRLSVYRTKGRTNNPTEASNRKLLRFLIGNATPNYFIFLRRIKESLKTSNLDFISLRNGLSITSPIKKETINLNYQILKGWEKFDRDQVIWSITQQVFDRCRQWWIW